MQARRHLASLALILPLQALAAFAEEPADRPADPSIHELEVVDVNEFRLQVEKTELEFHPDPGALDSGSTEVEERLFDFTPLATFNPYLFDSERVECPLIPAFNGRPVTRAPVATFRTGFKVGADVKTWQLAITDYRGEIFRRVTGEGLPPDELDWDGRGDHDEVLRPGFPYSFVFTIEDSGTNRYQYAGNTFALPFHAYKDGRNLILEVSGHSLFEKQSSATVAEGESRIDRLLREILDAPDRAIQVEAWAESADLAEARAAWLADRLEDRLLLAAGQISHAGFAYKGNPPGRDGLLRLTLQRGGRR